jgi:hypothetical protein
MTKLRRICAGSRLTICAVINQGDRCRIQEDLDAIRKYDKKTHGRLWATIEHIAEHGMDDFNPARLKNVGDGCYEIEDNRSNTRLYCFTHPKTNTLIIVERIADKGAKKEQNQNIQRLKIARQYFRTEAFEIE